jgi:hypothetical protein
MKDGASATTLIEQLALLKNKQRHNTTSHWTLKPREEQAAAAGSCSVP